jgi:hypothetical protein
MKFDDQCVRIQTVSSKECVYKLQNYYYIMFFSGILQDKIVF